MSKPISKGEQILEAMKTRFALIATGVDYNYTYAGIVLISPASPQTGGVYINPGSDNIDDSEISMSLQDITMPVNIDLVEINGVMDRYLMEADILKSIAQDKTFGGLCWYLKHTESHNDPANQQGDFVCHRRIVVEVTYRKNAFSI